MNPVTDFKPEPIKFGVYRLSLSINTAADRGSSVDISEYFGQAEWEELSVIEQHNWLDDFAQSWADHITNVSWYLVRNNG